MLSLVNNFTFLKLLSGKCWRVSENIFNIRVSYFGSKTLQCVINTFTLCFIEEGFAEGVRWRQLCQDCLGRHFSADPYHLCTNKLISSQIWCLDFFWSLQAAVDPCFCFFNISFELPSCCACCVDHTALQKIIKTDIFRYFQYSFLQMMSCCISMPVSFCVAHIYLCLFTS